ncbi:MAG TPA: SRPBCC family protein [Rhodocyclaceae bacterium]|nr:SRPBCC family protein [Rhodocyclaceae bacterium]
MCRLCLWMLICVAGGHAWTSAIAFSFDARRRGDGVDIVAVAELRADVDEAWRVLTAYERYADFVPDVTLSRVVQRDGLALVLELNGALRILWWRLPLAVRLAISEMPPFEVRARLIEGTLREMHGRYVLAPRPGGARLTYHGRIVPESGLRGLLDAWIVRRSASRQFGALVDEIERLAAPAAGVPGAVR